MKYGLVGAKLGHSFSPDIHKLIGDYEYKLAEMTESELDCFLKAKEFCGVNVTIPYKETVIPYLDEISDAAKSIGAVNVIVNKNGKLCGHNTDYNGAYSLIRRIGLDLKNKKVLILGTGGTSKTMTAVARDMGASSIVIVSRHAGENVVTYDEAGKNHGDADVIINTTPLGMYPKSEGCPIDINLFPSLEGVADAIFNPIATPLVRHAKARGLKAEGGLYMLVVQAVYASALFFGSPADESIIDRVYNAVRSKKQNLVLIGMPSSGKTTVGKRIAQKSGKAFVDTDAEIALRAGMTIPEIFEKYGEPHFRDIEKQVIADVSKRQGIIIATGGGAVMNDENVFSLRSNGMLICLDRPLEKLISTSDRPLASDRAKLEKLYETRKDRYNEVSDFIIPAGGTVSEVSEIVSEVFES